MNKFPTIRGYVVYMNTSTEHKTTYQHKTNSKK